MSIHSVIFYAGHPEVGCGCGRVTYILWVGIRFLVGRPTYVGGCSYCSMGLILLSRCWLCWVPRGSPSGCGRSVWEGVHTILWVWSLWVGVDPVGFSVGRPTGVNDQCGRVYIPFCGSDLCGWVLTQLGSPWVAQRVWAMPQCVMNDMSYFISASATK